jgi:hypothetical protein
MSDYWLQKLDLESVPFALASVLYFIDHHRHFQAALFFLKAALVRRLCQFPQVFTFLDFATIILLQSNVVSLAFNPQSGGPGLCIYVPQLQDGPVITPGTWFLYHRLPRPAGLG